MIYKRAKSWHMDVTIHGVRYREALHTTDKREAIALEKRRVADIQSGKGASLSGREFARQSFVTASEQYLEDRKPHTAERTQVLERNLLSPLKKFFGDKPLIRIRAEDISTYQRARRQTGISGRTLNMEIQVLRGIMKKAKIWSIVAEDVKLDPENRGAIGRVLTDEEKRLFFETANSKDEWMVACCAGVLAVNTTCRGVELKHLRWQDVDLFERSIVIRRSKTAAGHRPIPLNGDAAIALARLAQRAEALGSADPEHFVFPACERNKIDPTKPQKTWRTAWRSLVEAAAKRAGDAAAQKAVETGRNPEDARLKAASSFVRDRWRLRFHDLRHQAITELAETGASDATMMALAGHMSRAMLEHYSHVRMAAKREAIDRLSSGLMQAPAKMEDERSASIN